MRILQVGYAQTRRWGKARVSTEHKLYNGLVRNCHNVLHYSDRDMAAFLAPFGLRDLGKGKSNRKLVEVASNFRPDLILLGHCDIIRNETLLEIRRLLPEVRIAYRNVDPLFVPHNVEAIHRRKEVVDTIFVTTAGPGLDPFKGYRATVHYMPNPTDVAIEFLENASRVDLPIDLFFCGNSNEHTTRKDTVVALSEQLRDSDLVFKTYGFFGEPNVWGRDYDAVLAQSKMGLNLNRQEGDFLYSSARLAQLMGNGIVPAIHRACQMQVLLGEERAVFFDSVEELIPKLKELHADDAQRRALAAEGQRFYREHFCSERVAQYIVERTMGIPFSHDYIWQQF
ncbi:glycosyltransferase [Coraliomargarita parva]|uniref:glycosyltransferase family protein n=1 Tax=Coraliomargarita parva TaxID=3014050 RepID=UPI0022B41E5A|nr:glycosyltransferase [Coraliomargarita parva]